MRTIMYSNERVTANNWEAGLFILFLLIFAIAASWHVFSHGIQVRCIHPTTSLFL
jgi:cation-transporting ATPase 13A1